MVVVSLTTQSSDSYSANYDDGEHLELSRSKMKRLAENNEEISHLEPRMKVIDREPSGDDYHADTDPSSHAHPYGPEEFIIYGLQLYDMHRLPRDTIVDSSPLTHLTSSQLVSELTCYICEGLLNRPYAAMECLHRFCFDCISRYIRVGRKECPICCVKLASTRAMRPDQTIEAIIKLLYPSTGSNPATMGSAPSKSYANKWNTNTQVERRVAIIAERRSHGPAPADGQADPLRTLIYRPTPPRPPPPLPSIANHIKQEQSIEDLYETESISTTTPLLASLIKCAVKHTPSSSFSSSNPSSDLTVSTSSSKSGGRESRRGRPKVKAEVAMPTSMVHPVSNSLNPSAVNLNFELENNHCDLSTLANASLQSSPLPPLSNIHSQGSHPNPNLVITSMPFNLHHTTPLDSKASFFPSQIAIGAEEITVGRNGAPFSLATTTNYSPMRATSGPNHHLQALSNLADESIAILPSLISDSNELASGCSRGRRGIKAALHSRSKKAHDPIEMFHLTLLPHPQLVSSDLNLSHPYTVAPVDATMEDLKQFLMSMNTVCSSQHPASHPKTDIQANHSDVHSSPLHASISSYHIVPAVDVWSQPLDQDITLEASYQQFFRPHHKEMVFYFYLDEKSKEMAPTMAQVFTFPT